MQHINEYWNATAMAAIAMAVPMTNADNTDADADNTNNPEAQSEAQAQMFTGSKSEFGMKVFSDPCAQAAYKHCEDNYKKMTDLKRAYDTQVLLRKMRADMRREYLTRKNQIKRLQTDAAVDFRTAHYLLEQHHHMNTETFGGCKFGVCGVDISAPIVSQIQLPGETVDLKTFNKDLEFDKVREMHETIQANVRQRWTEEEEEEANTPPCLYRRDATRGAFGGCYDYNEGEQEQGEQEQGEQEQGEQEQGEQEQEQDQEDHLDDENNGIVAAATTPNTNNPNTIYGEDGSMYTGFVNENGEKHGQGTFRTAIYISGIVGDENSHLSKWTEYSGNWHDGLLHGHGVMREMSDKGVVNVVHDGMWDMGVQVRDRAAMERLIMASLTTSRDFDFIAMCDNQNGPWCCDD
jgi:hypothetical protein